MGIGGALIMPATLSIITNVFPAKERGRAIGAWAGTAGIAVALGPLAGGFLLEHFYWGSVFLVNLPIVAIGLVAGIFLIPTSRDPAAPRLDPFGALLSIVGLTVLVYAIIEAPQDGWTDSMILGSFGAAAVLLGAFLWCERTTVTRCWTCGSSRTPFSAASTGITMTFFALFGATFLLTQYMQFVLGYTPLEAGVRLLPFAVVILVVSPLSARIVEKLGTKVTVATGPRHGNCARAHGPAPDGQLVRRPGLADGALLRPGPVTPATESIMGSLPLASRGLGGQRRPARSVVRSVSDRRQRDVLTYSSRSSTLPPARRQVRQLSNREGFVGWCAAAPAPKAPGALAQPRLLPSRRSSTAHVGSFGGRRDSGDRGAVWLPHRDRREHQGAGIGFAGARDAGRSCG